MPGAGTLRPGVTVLGNLAVDRIDGAPPSAGGCPTFAGAALAVYGEGRVVGRAASADLALFHGVVRDSSVPATILPADCTAGFQLRYAGDLRTMSVDAIGPVWEPSDLQAAEIDTDWVHVSPLLRTDFPPHTLAALAAAGHTITYDGQGLVRASQLGPMAVDRAYDAALLRHLTVLKLADDEAAALTPGDGPFGLAEAAALGVPEILVTYGSEGCHLFTGGAKHDIPAPWRVDRVHTTGAGDLFTVAYAAARARGEAPVRAAEVASRLVAELLEARRAEAD